MANSSDSNSGDKKNQDFFKALVQTTRALTGVPTLKVVSQNERDNERDNELAWASGQQTDAGSPTLHLPSFPTHADDETRRDYQSLANREAFLWRYGGGQSAGVADLNVPASVLSDIIKPLDVAWTEAKGKLDFKGSAAGLESLRRREIKNVVEQTAEYSSHQQLGHVLSTALRHEMGEKPVPEEKQLLKQYKKYLTSDVREWLRSAAKHLPSATERSRLYRELVQILDLAPPEEDPPQSQNESENESEASQKEEQSGTVSDQQHEAPHQDNVESTSNVESEQKTETENDQEQNQEDDGAQAQAQAGNRPSFGSNSSPYYIFTTKHDKVTGAEKLFPAPEIDRLQTRYKKVTSGTKNTVSKMAIKLQQLLLAQTNFDWRFDQEEGVLDAKKLPQIVASSDPYPHKKQHIGNERDTVVTLLLDNSGSMRGRPIEMAALSADVLTRTLERCGVKTEVLGFTTQTWKGGQSRLDWISAGSPDNPGRLNDNLQIVYKNADKSYQASRRAFPVMLADDLLKENIDGESLLWAYGRLLKRRENRRILLVISDGAPVDYATDKYNPANFLDKHLRTTVHHIEKQNQVELLAIGIGHDVRRYYKNAVTIQNPDALSETLVNQMVHLFSAKGKKQGGMTRA